MKSPKKVMKPKDRQPYTVNMSYNLGIAEQQQINKNDALSKKQPSGQKIDCTR